MNFYKNDKYDWIIGAENPFIVKSIPDMPLTFQEWLFTMFFKYFLDDHSIW